MQLERTTQDLKRKNETIESLKHEIKDLISNSFLSLPLALYY